MTRTAATAEAMRSAAERLLSALSDRQRGEAAHAFTDPARTRWTYLPRPRPGVGLIDLDRTARKAAHRLLATAVSRPTFAQIVTVMGFEEVLDHDEGGGRGRHSDDYLVAVFGAPDERMWSWRFEGHHISVTATIADDIVTVAPLFLGVNPARVEERGHLVVGPLWREEEMARAMLSGLTPERLARAVVAETAPPDILTKTSPYIENRLDPPGVHAAELSADERALLRRLLEVYLDRLAPELAEAEYARIPPEEVSFAWAGGRHPGEGHYYRLQAPGLLIEYDNTQRGANHAHTVYRRPGADFGAALLASHLAAERRGSPA